MDLVAGLGLGGARAAIERLYPHPPHQRLQMPAADLAPLQSQQASQHTRTGERISDAAANAGTRVGTMLTKLASAGTPRRVGTGVQTTKL
jgi:hypothetical protein